MSPAEELMSPADEPKYRRKYRRVQTQTQNELDPSERVTCHSLQKSRGEHSRMLLKSPPSRRIVMFL